MDGWTDYLPITSLPPLEPFEHYDHGKDADPTLSDLFPKDRDVKVEDLTPAIGAEVHGVQLSQLTNAGKDQLALFVAQKKVVGKYCPYFPAKLSPLEHLLTESPASLP
jgi:sulfonate dioxygenase